MLIEDLDSLFYLPLSPEALGELLSLQSTLSAIHYDPTMSNSWSFLWGSPAYSSRRYYKSVFNNFPASPIFKKMWHAKYATYQVLHVATSSGSYEHQRHALAKKLQRSTQCQLCDVLTSFGRGY
jgi:hypothetical protein